jgi:hypothetical protein
MLDYRTLEAVGDLNSAISAKGIDDVDFPSPTADRPQSLRYVLLLVECKNDDRDVSAHIFRSSARVENNLAGHLGVEGSTKTLAP